LKRCCKENGATIPLLLLSAFGPSPALFFQFSFCQFLCDLSLLSALRLTSHPLELTSVLSFSFSSLPHVLVTSKDRRLHPCAETNQLVSWARKVSALHWLSATFKGKMEKGKGKGTEGGKPASLIFGCPTRHDLADRNRRPGHQNKIGLRTGWRFVHVS